jgi:alpha-L-arabinofuranosidase
VGGQDVGTLVVLAVRKGPELYIVGINRSPTEALSTRLLLEGSTATRAGGVACLDGASALSYNTAAVPQAVHLSTSELAGTGSNLGVTFPAHSVTTLRLPVAPARS